MEYGSHPAWITAPGTLSAMSVEIETTGPAPVDPSAREQMVPMRDGVPLATDVYLPVHGNPVHAGGGLSASISFSDVTTTGTYWAGFSAVKCQLECDAKCYFFAALSPMSRASGGCVSISFFPEKRRTESAPTQSPLNPSFSFPCTFNP